MTRLITLNNGLLKWMKTQSTPLQTPGEVLIRQNFVGVNHEDVEIMHNSIKAQGKAFTFGFEGAGVIEDIVQTGVRTLKKGDRVCYFYNKPKACAERVIVSEHLVLKIYDDIDEVVGASIRKAILAHTILYRLFKIGQGSWMVVTGSTGGVGHYLCQWAAALGINVIAVIANEDDRALAASYGCKAVVNFKKQDLVSEVMKLTNNVGAEYVIDCIGYDFFDIGVKTLMFFGKYISIGALSGEINFNIKLLQEKSVFFVPVNMWHYNSFSHQAVVAALEFFENVSLGKIRPNIKKYSFKDGIKAFNNLETDSNKGCNVISLI